MGQAGVPLGKLRYFGGNDGPLGIDFHYPLRSLSPLSAMKLKIRNSKSKKAKKTGFLTRQKTAGGRKVNKRHRSRHGSF